MTPAMFSFRSHVGDCRRTSTTHRFNRPGRRHTIAALALGVMVFVAACGDSVVAPAGIVRDPAPDVSAIVLPDGSAGGAPFATSADPGELLLVYFGFTACPDVCPTTLADVRSALRLMNDEDAARVDLAMVTVDPGRDDAERLTAYVQSFFPGAHALRTDDPAQLQAAADAYGASYSVTTDTEGNVEVEHSAFLYAVDSEGRLRLSWPFGTKRDDIRNDLKYLFDEGV